jgi:hypothetical protein
MGASSTDPVDPYMKSFLIRSATIVLPILLLSYAQSKESAPAAVPPFVQRAQPGAGQRALNPLAGNWQVEKYLYVAVGTREKPARSEKMLTERVWIAAGRFLRDTTRGTIGGKPYFRTGFLGYNNMDRCYEWVTADAFTPILMIYRGKQDAGPGLPVSMEGSFTDLGVTGEQNVGKRVPMRTVIRIESPDRHSFEIYFTPPGGPEMLADKMIFTRIADSGHISPSTTTP